MSSHPLARYESDLNAFSTHRVADLADLPEKSEVTVGGMIQGVTLRNRLQKPIRPDEDGEVHV